ncbi:Imm1 family immunity protein [Streptomyces zaomyceticus]|uniref:Imm1 family immunity protein n=1 Tax=Streptomyces zaomyceticus TaxID=68286 RepID=A0ABZ1LR27_9ACTN|nr:Imm1 family immunity protein [Streptomyces zaomyceticus]
MIVAVHTNGETENFPSVQEAIESVDSVLHALDGGLKASATWLAIDEGTEAPKSFLEVTADAEKNIAGAVWFAGDEEAQRIENEEGSDRGNYFWVSDSGRGPETDVTLLSDPHAPSYFDPRGILSIPEVSKAVEEFCLSGGNLPSSIRWVAGNQNGTRID